MKKCLEKLVMTHINSIIADSLDPLQFTYRPNRSVDDAIGLADNRIRYSSFFRLSVSLFCMI